MAGFIGSRGKELERLIDHNIVSDALVRWDRLGTRARRAVHLCRWRGPPDRDHENSKPRRGASGKAWRKRSVAAAGAAGSMESGTGGSRHRLISACPPGGSANAAVKLAPVSGAPVGRGPVGSAVSFNPCRAASRRRAGESVRCPLPFLPCLVAASTALRASAWHHSARAFNSSMALPPGGPGWHSHE